MWREYYNIIYLDGNSQPIIAPLIPTLNWTKYSSVIINIIGIYTFIIYWLMLIIMR